MQKRNDYVRYKVLRKINRRRKADQEKQSKIAEKELKKRLRFTPRKFYLGKDPENNQQDYSDFSPESRMLLLAYDQDMKNLEDYGISSNHFAETQKYIEKTNNKQQKSGKYFSRARFINDMLDQTNVVKDLQYGLNEAINNQDEQRRQIVQEYKNVINAMLTAAELTSSAGLLGRVYGNYRNWANSANKYKRGIINLLTENEKLLSGLGVASDAGQLMTENNPTEQPINKAELPASTAGFIGATDHFRNSSLYNNFGPRIDLGLDAIGVGQAMFDIGRFGYKNVASPIIRSVKNKKK